MIEIVFSDSACGSLKVAQRYGVVEYQGGSIGVIVSHSDGRKPTKEEVETAKRDVDENMRLSWKNATPLGGNPADVYGFNLALSVGDISENPPDIKRTQALEHLYSVYPNDEGRQAAKEISKRVHENIEIVRERTAAGESLRIWYSNQPDEMCGLYWFMYQLSQWEVSGGQASIIKLPEWESNDTGTIVRKSSCGEVAPQEWNRYLVLQKPVLPAFRASCAYDWRKLQEENAPLRAVLNGQLVSAVKNLYDTFILREIAAEGDEFQEAIIVGRVLGKYQLGIGDAWIALRIEEMIRAGTLEVVSAADKDMPAYHRVLKKCNFSD